MRVEDLIYNMALAAFAKEADMLEGMWPSPQRNQYNPGAMGEMGYEMMNTFRHPLDSVAKIPQSIGNIGSAAWNALPSMPSMPSLNPINTWNNKITNPINDATGQAPVPPQGAAGGAQ